MIIGILKGLGVAPSCKMGTVGPRAVQVRGINPVLWEPATANGVNLTSVLFSEESPVWCRRGSRGMAWKGNPPWYRVPVFWQQGPRK